MVNIITNNVARRTAHAPTNQQSDFNLFNSPTKYLPHKTETPLNTPHEFFPFFHFVSSPNISVF